MSIKKILSVLLILVMIAGVCPFSMATTASAADVYAVNVTVRDLATDEIIKTAVVVICPTGMGASDPGAVTAEYSAASEAYILSPGLENGSYDILVTAPGYEDASPTTIGIVNGPFSTTVKLADMNVTYEGTIKDARGDLMDNVTIKAVRSDLESDIHTYTTDETGEFSLDLNRDFTYDITIEQYGETYLTDTLANPTDTTTALYMLSGWYTTEVSIVLEDGSAAKLNPYIAGGTERFFAVDVSGIAQQIVADADGKITFLGNNQPTTVTVASQGPFHMAQKMINDCSATPSAEVELSLMKVKLIVEDIDGNPVTAVRTAVIIDGLSAKAAKKSALTVSDTGEYEITGLEADSSQNAIGVWADGYAYEQGEVTLTTDGSPIGDVSVVVKRGAIRLDIRDIKVNLISSGNSVSVDDPDVIITSLGGGQYQLRNVPVGKDISISIVNSSYKTQVLVARLTSSDEKLLTAFLNNQESGTTGAISGSVTDSNNVPIDKALVRVGKYFTFTNAQGAYSLAGLPINVEYDIEVEKDGYALYTMPQAVMFTSAKLTIAYDKVALKNAAGIQGVIKNSSGTPVVGQIVAAGAKSILVKSNGEYTITGLVDGAHDISVSADGYLSDAYTVSTTAGAVATQNITLQSATATAYSVSGRVLDAGGNPLAGATIECGGQKTVSDENGEFVIGNLSSVVTSAVVSKAGYVAQSKSISFGGGTSAGFTVALKKNTASSAYISGKVINENNAALPGMTAELIYYDAAEKAHVVAASTISSSTGVFTFSNLENGVKYTVRVRGGQYSVFEAACTASAVDNMVTVKLVPAGTVKLTVTGAGAAPLPGAECFVPILSKTFTANSSGEIMLDSFEFGRSYEMIISGDGYATQTKYQTLTAATPNVEVAVAMSAVPAGKASLDGFVTDKNTGEVLAGVVVSGGSSRGVTDQDGYFYISGLEKGATVTMSVSKESYSGKSEQVMLSLAQSTNRQDFVMERSYGEVSGKVTDGKDLPIEGVTVSITGYGASTVTLSDGSYVLKGVPVGVTASIMFRKTGYGEHTMSVTLSKTSSDAIYSTAMKRTVSVEVYVMDSASHETVKTATVSIYKADKGPNDPSAIKIPYHSGSETYRLLDGIEEGEYRLFVTASGYTTPNATTVTLVPDKFSAEVRLSKGTTTNPGGSTGGGGTPSVPRPSTTPTPTPTPTDEPGPTTPPAEWTKFEDLDDPNLSWATTPIYALVEEGVLSKATYFRPNDNVTREEFIKMLVECFDIYNPNAVCDFTDADPNAWYYPYVASAYQMGILMGNDDGTFGQGQNITRQDMATMCFRSASNMRRVLTPMHSPEKFADDADIADYAKEAVGIMQQRGIINGMGDGRFAPRDYATRAQSAKIIHGMMELPQF